MNVVYLSIGSNLGDRKHHLASIIQKLEENQIQVLSQSSIYLTAPWGVKTQQEDYFNQALKIQTELYPFELLNLLKKIEIELGRDQKGDYQPRTADIDIIAFNDWQIHSENLKIPHPEYKNRLFVLIPLQEITPDFIDPTQKISIQEMIDQCSCHQKVIKLSDNVL